MLWSVWGVCCGMLCGKRFREKKAPFPLCLLLLYVVGCCEQLNLNSQAQSVCSLLGRAGCLVVVVGSGRSVSTTSRDVAWRAGISGVINFRLEQVITLRGLVA